MTRKRSGFSVDTAMISVPKKKISIFVGAAETSGELAECRKFQQKNLACGIKKGGHSATKWELQKGLLCQEEKGQSH